MRRHGLTTDEAAVFSRSCPCRRSFERDERSSGCCAPQTKHGDVPPALTGEPGSDGSNGWGDL